MSELLQFLRDGSCRCQRFSAKSHRLDNVTSGTSGGALQGVVVEVGIDGGGGKPSAAEQATYGGQPLTVHHALGGEAVPQLVDAHAVESGLGSQPAPETLVTPSWPPGSTTLRRPLSLVEKPAMQ